jgi:hypothetical protein
MVGLESVAIPYAAWECRGFNSDSWEDPPVVTVDSQVTIEMSLEEGSTVELRVDNESVPTDPAPVAGANSWTLGLTTADKEVTVRLCSAEAACALYVAALEHRSDG